jgi:hypothetical protein
VDIECRSPRAEELSDASVAFAWFLHSFRLLVRVRYPVGDAPNSKTRIPKNGCSSRSLPERNYLTSSAADFGANNSA